MNKGVYCEFCKKPIRIRPDLVTATLFWEVVPYHEGCYAKNLKSARSFFVSNSPINGTASNWTLGFLGILTILGLFTQQSFGYVTLVLFGIGLMYRGYSYVKFERKLEK